MESSFFFGLGVVVVAFHLVFHPEFLWVDTCYCHIGLFVLLAEPLLTPAGLTMFLKFQKSEKRFNEVFKFDFGNFFSLNGVTQANDTYQRYVVVHL